MPVQSRFSNLNLLLFYRSRCRRRRRCLAPNCNNRDLTIRRRKQVYSQLSLRRTPLGPALSVRLREVSVL